MNIVLRATCGILGIAFFVVGYKQASRLSTFSNQEADYGSCHALVSVKYIVSAIFLFCALFPPNNGFEELLCWSAGAAFLVAAFLFLHKDKISLAFFICVIAAFFFFSGQTWVQGLLKGEVTSQITRYGEEFVSNQTSLTELQKSIYRQLPTELQPVSTGTVTQIQSSQAKDAESFVKFLYANMQFEDFGVANDPDVVGTYITNNVYLAVFKLKYAPIPNSVQAQAWPGNPSNIPESFIQPIKTYKNILIRVLYGFNPSQTRVAVQYVADVSETNLIQKVKIEGNKIFADDHPLINLSDLH